MTPTRSWERREEREKWKKRNNEREYKSNNKGEGKTERRGKTNRGRFFTKYSCSVQKEDNIKFFCSHWLNRAFRACYSFLEDPSP